MDFQLTSEQELMRESIWRLAERDITPLFTKHASNQALPKADCLSILAKLAESGLTTPHLPVAAGDGANEILALIHGRELTGIEALRGSGRAAAPR